MNCSSSPLAILDRQCPAHCMTIVTKLKGSPLQVSCYNVCEINQFEDCSEDNCDCVKCKCAAY